ncbi:isocitrate lyase/phosphoenolpyruvate mutase family protein [Kiloniella laminariae]|uniref:Isocitrate lyase/phosphoenolpyruvate mutase family protein n=2 Tax=Kiloniella laminariae TaxID=454162 RepID=A0ABT4LFP4_9PROT|nr:isocitrate lyase/phosphoenolpyruvate mutase family protein [Kiloniella laminariae]MCZ4279921.1 isocitrate lyase/phosphoenolpyruvate mutase family protein [Kiloniella laminariae]
MLKSQQEKYEAFKALHEKPGAFLMPNPWNAGTARMLSGLGFEALATTSAGLAFSLGYCDATAGLSREITLENAREIVAATELPVSADLEDGFGADPESCAETIRQAAAVGLVGGSIEDATGDAADPIFDFDLAVERVRAACEASRGLPFLLTARSENFLHGRPDLDDTIRRLQAFEQAGADVLYAPGLPDLEAIRKVCAAVSKPVNVVLGRGGLTYSLEDLAAAGVKRVSTGGSFARAALGGMMRAALEIRDQGSFSYADEALSHQEVSSYMVTAKR